MLRRFALLAVLLLTLTVVTPALFACDTAGSCCPPGAPPCESQSTAQLSMCCLEQPMAAPVLSATVTGQLASLDSLLLHGTGPGPVNSSAIHADCRHSFVYFQQLPPAVRDQQQLYLHTGRLRL